MLSEETSTLLKKGCDKHLGLMVIVGASLVSIVIVAIEIGNPNSLHPHNRNNDVTNHDNFQLALFSFTAVSISPALVTILNIFVPLSKDHPVGDKLSKTTPHFIPMIFNLVLLILTVLKQPQYLIFLFLRVHSIIVLLGFFIHLWSFGQIFQTTITFFTAIIGVLSVAIPPLSFGCHSCPQVIFWTHITLLISFILLLIKITSSWMLRLWTKRSHTITPSEWSCSLQILGIILYMTVLLVASLATGEMLDGRVSLLYIQIFIYSLIGWSLFTTVLSTRLLQLEIYRLQELLEKNHMLVRYISHEIRTPLNTVFVGLDVLRNELKNTQNTDHNADQDADRRRTQSIIQDLHESCDVTLNILNELLDYEKLEAGIMTLDEEVVDASPFFNQLIHSFVLQAQQKKIIFETNDINFDLQNIQLKIDKSKLGQVIRNLISNAIKFTPKKGFIRIDVNVIDARNRITFCSNDEDNDKNKTRKSGSRASSVVKCKKLVIGRTSIITRNPTLTSSISKKDKGNTTDIIGNNNNNDSLHQSYLRFQIVDSGAGLAPENIPRIFHEVVQFHPNKLQNGGGSGLGLRISKAIVDLHRGGVSVQSLGEGHGCTFTMEIPIYSSTATPVSASFGIDVERRWSRSIINSIRMKPVMIGSEGGGPVDVDSYANERKRASSDFHRSMPKIHSSQLSDHSDVSLHLEVALKLNSDTRTRGIVFNCKSTADFESRTSTSDFYLNSSEHHHQQQQQQQPTMLGEVFNILDAKTSDDDGCSSDETQVKSQGHSHMIKQDHQLQLEVGILLVDDSLITRRLLRRSLEDRGYGDVRGCSDGQEALDMIRAMNNDNSEFNLIQVILMDYQMPEMDGPTAAKKLRDAGYKGLIIGVTGNCSMNDMKYFISQGADTVFVKPVVMDDLDLYLRQQLQTR